MATATSLRRTCVAAVWVRCSSGRLPDAPTARAVVLSCVDAAGWVPALVRRQ